MSSKQRSEELRQQGNDCVKAGNYNEAVIHYSHALQSDANNHLLYSNRSFAFLKLEQYYLAQEDARKTITLQPKWPKGFYRKGEVEFQVGHYQAALISYGKAMLLEPTNEEVRQAVAKTNTELLKWKTKARRDPWLYCGCGSLLGLFVVLADQYLADKPSIQNLVIQFVLVVVFGCLGYLVLYVFRYIKQSETRSLLEPPVDLLQEMQGTKTTETEPETDPGNQNGTTRPTHRKGGVGAARQRFKKGKT